MKIRFTHLVLLVFIFSSIFSYGQILTTAEKSNYESTSTHQDVMDFVTQLTKTSNLIRMETLATSIEGHEIPLVILADPMPISPKDLQGDDRIVVYIQANIHAGEVEGKEATQMLLRDLLKEHPKEIFDNVVLLVCPIFNTDGNEKFSTKNRTNQVGPVNGVGVRHNGQYLDLNRDAMKLETPELQGLVGKVFNQWDPAITVDCHTTNGSYHEEPVTFTWMMNPNGDRNLINYMRDEMMPDVHENLLVKYHVENVFYGEFLDRLNLELGWTSYAAEARYLVNYVGVRNRLGILNENYVYADFKTRVEGSYFLLRSIVEYASDHKKEIKSLLNKADETMMKRHFDHQTDSLAIEYKGVPTPNLITIKAFEADTIPGVRGYWRYKQSDRKRTVKVPYIADYYSTRSIAIPYAYILSINVPEVIENLKLHGIQVDHLKNDTTLLVEYFKIENLMGDKMLFQGHYQNKVIGSYISETQTFPKGTAIIYTQQKLGNLAAYLLEPETDDGYLKWNFFDRYLVPQWGSGYYPYPVYRLPKAH